jgi:hypothetical protein
MTMALTVSDAREAADRAQYALEDTTFKRALVFSQVAIALAIQDLADAARDHSANFIAMPLNELVEAVGSIGDTIAEAIKNT